MRSATPDGGWPDGRWGSSVITRLQLLQVIRGRNQDVDVLGGPGGAVDGYRHPAAEGVSDLRATSAAHTA